MENIKVFGSGVMREDRLTSRLVDAIQKVLLILSIPQWIGFLIASSGGIIVTFIWRMSNPYFGIIFGILLTITVFAIIAIIVNRDEEKRLRKELDKVSINNKARMGKMKYKTKTNIAIPAVEFKIKVKNGSPLDIEPQKILLDLTCDSIHQKTYFWDRSYNIEEVKETPDIEAPDIGAGEDGYIWVRYPCVNVFYNHRDIHIWQLKGRITFNSKIGNTDIEHIRLTFQLDKDKEEELKKDMKTFHEFYVKGGGF